VRDTEPGEEGTAPDREDTTSPPVAPSPRRPVVPSRSWVVGERVRLRKAHPCGSTDWRISRVGADIRITCEGCGRRVMLPRDEFNRRVKAALDGPPGR
jgi:hypothetical protein